MFLAGLVPGLLVGLSLMVFNRILATRQHDAGEGQPRDRSETSLDGLALGAPGIILAILFGRTATEAGTGLSHTLVPGSLPVHHLERALHRAE